jgi:hypothetical protein
MEYDSGRILLKLFCYRTPQKGNLETWKNFFKNIKVSSKEL